MFLWSLILVCRFMCQIDFFASNKAFSEFLSIREVAQAIDVSEASVRNWIKTKYLEYGKKGIPVDSFDFFMKNIAGIEKLNKRANKSLLDSHNHEELSKNILENISMPNVSDRYQNGLSIAYRNKEGIYYTPEYICREMFLDVPLPDEDKTFCDPCCGSGNFIMQAIDFGFSVKKIYGFDIDPLAVEITKQRIFQKTGCRSENIHCLDFFEASKNDAYDYIFTNPPWGKKIDKQKKIEYQKMLGLKNTTDSSALFFIKAFNLLKYEGFLAFLMPDSFFKISSFAEVRKKLLDNCLVSLRDFDSPFKGIQAKAQSFCIRKNRPNENIVVCNKGGSSFTRSQSSFIKNPACIINFSATSMDSEVIDAIYKKPSIRLKGKAQWGLGIVTGNNKKFCHSEMMEGLMPVYRGADIYANFLNKPKNFISKDLSLYQQVPPVHLFEAKEKIVYRFISSSLVFYHDKNQCYFLNSANMLLPDEDFPVSMSALVWLFNTKLYNWLFKCVFNTNKVLRSDLEKIPIPVDFLQEETLSEDAIIRYFSIVRAENGAFRVKK